MTSVKDPVNAVGSLTKILVMKLLLAGVPALFLLAACSLQDRDLAPPTGQPRVTGLISGGSGKGRLYAVLYDLGFKAPRPIVDQLVGKDGRFDFAVTGDSTFGVAAFEDLNGNLRQDTGEYAGYVRFPKARVVPTEKVAPKAQKNINLRKRTRKVANPVILSEEAAREVAKRDKALAKSKSKPAPPAAKKVVKKAPPVRDVVSLSEARFGMAAAAEGFRDPQGFVKKHGNGLYLVDPYRGTKMPVIFVHGIGSASQDWRALFSQLDLSRVQPLIYHYPTGMSLDTATERLVRYSGEMAMRYKFSEMQVVGLGTGGLIAKQFAQRMGGKRVTSLVTLGTPWGGVAVPSAKVQRGHASWDLRSNSPFLKQARRPAAMAHHLIFAYKDPRSLQSQLDPRVQDQAIRVRGFATTERDLLSERGAAALVNQGLGSKR